MRYYDSDSYSLMQMRHLLPFQIKARPQGGIESKHLSAPAMRQIAVVCHARKHRTGTAQPTLVSTSAECSLSPAEQPAKECTMPPVCAHRALLRVRLLCSVCCSTLSSTQQAIGPICAGRYALDRGRFGRSNASLRCPVNAAYPEIRQVARRLACKRACVCECARG